MEELDLEPGPLVGKIKTYLLKKVKEREVVNREKNLISFLRTLDIDDFN